MPIKPDESEDHGFHGGLYSLLSSCPVTRLHILVQTLARSRYFDQYEGHLDNRPCASISISRRMTKRNSLPETNQQTFMETNQKGHV